MLPFLGEYLYAKNNRNWYPNSSDIDDQRFPQSDWVRAFLPITGEPEVSQIWALHGKTESCHVFYFRLLPAKSNNIS